VIRQVPDRDQPVVIGVSIRKAKASSAENLVLAPGDVISVEETPVTFIVDTIRGFIRFGFSSAIPGV
jgi:polysaccharide export outer membrane protein